MIGAIGFLSSLVFAKSQGGLCECSGCCCCSPNPGPARRVGPGAWSRGSHPTLATGSWPGGCYSSPCASTSLQEGLGRGVCYGSVLTHPFPFLIGILLRRARGQAGSYHSSTPGVGLLLLPLPSGLGQAAINDQPLHFCNF